MSKFITTVFVIVVLTACSPSKEQVAATMAVQTSHSIGPSTIAGKVEIYRQLIIVPEIVVALFVAGNEGNNPTQEIKTNPEGEFVFEDVTPGIYNLMVTFFVEVDTQCSTISPDFRMSEIGLQAGNEAALWANSSDFQVENGDQIRKDVTINCTSASAGAGTPIPDSPIPTTHTPLPEAVEFYEQAQSFSTQGEDEKAIEAYTKAIEADPLYGPPYINRGSIYGQYGETEKALADFNKGLELDPTNALGYTNRAQAQIALGNFKEALADIKSCLTLTEDEYYIVVSLFLGGQVYEELGETDLAIAAYSKAIEIDEYDSFALLHRGQIYLQQEDWLRAFADLALVLETSQMEGLQQAAFDILDNVYPEDTTWQEAMDASQEYYDQATGFRESGDYESSIQSLKKAIEIDPLNSDFYYQRSIELANSGELEDAIADMDYAVALDPFNVRGYFWRGMMEAENSMITEAIADLEKALEFELSSDAKETANQVLEEMHQRLETCQMTEFEVVNDADIPTLAFVFEGPPGEHFSIFTNTLGGSGSIMMGTIPESGITPTGAEYELKEGETTPVELEITILYEGCHLRKAAIWPEIDILAMLSKDDSAIVSNPEPIALTSTPDAVAVSTPKPKPTVTAVQPTPESLATKLYNFFCSKNLPFCNSSKEQIAATMAVQTIEARATGTAAIEQAVNNALTKAAPTLTPTQTHTATSMSTPIATHTPTFTATLEVQQYFTEEFDGGLENWSVFREKYNHDQVNWFLLSGKRTIQPVESLHVEDGYINFDNEKMEINYAIYEPFEYEGVRIDARFENKGSNEPYVNLICNYTENVGWYEIAMAPAGFWYIGFAVVKENDTVSHVKFHPKGRMSGTSGKIVTGEGFNEFTAICQGNKVTLYINGSLETEVEVTDLRLDSGKVGVAVRSFTQIPAKINLDWVKISQP